MQHTILKTEKNWQNAYQTVQLIAETAVEETILNNVEAMAASDEERETLDNYILFSVPKPAGYQVSTADPMPNNIVYIKYNKI